MQINVSMYLPVILAMTYPVSRAVKEHTQGQWCFLVSLKEGSLVDVALDWELTNEELAIEEVVRWNDGGRECATSRKTSKNMVHLNSEKTQHVVEMKGGHKGDAPE